MKTDVISTDATVPRCLFVRSSLYLIAASLSQFVGSMRGERMTNVKNALQVCSTADDVVLIFVMLFAISYEMIRVN